MIFDWKPEMEVYIFYAGLYQASIKFTQMTIFHTEGD